MAQDTVAFGKGCLQKRMRERSAPVRPRALPGPAPRSVSLWLRFVSVSRVGGNQSPRCRLCAPDGDGQQHLDAHGVWLADHPLIVFTIFICSWGVCRVLTPSSRFSAGTRKSPKIPGLITRRACVLLGRFSLPDSTPFPAVSDGVTSLRVFLPSPAVSRLLSPPLFRSRAAGASLRLATAVRGGGLHGSTGIPCRKFVWPWRGFPRHCGRAGLTEV